MLTVAPLSKVTRNHWTVHWKIVNFMLYEVYFSKVLFYLIYKLNTSLQSYFCKRRFKDTILTPACNTLITGGRTANLGPGIKQT